uniref:Uncharacterized protein n=1 Tax=Mesocestoides corti TaxID=53468 RepID=A0A5K3ETB4_MESCO
MNQVNNHKLDLEKAFADAVVSKEPTCLLMRRLNECSPLTSSDSNASSTASYASPEVAETTGKDCENSKENNLCKQESVTEADRGYVEPNQRREGTRCRVDASGTHVMRLAVRTGINADADEVLGVDAKAGKHRLLKYIRNLSVSEPTKLQQYGPQTHRTTTFRSRLKSRTTSDEQLWRCE